MTTQTEALKLALEALIGARAFLESDTPVEIWSLNDKAITAIKEALAQPEQEPVAWMLNGFPYKEKQVQVGGSCRGQEFPNQTPLYTTPPQRKPLTDDEIMNIAKVSCIGISPHEDALNFAKVIEAVHGIKE